MINIKIIFNENGRTNEQNIDIKAIDNFLAAGFGENIYDGEVAFKVYPAAVEPDWMQVIINLTKEEILKELVLAPLLKSVFEHLVTFFKKFKNYTPDISIRYKDEYIEFYADIKLDEKSNEEDILKAVSAIVKELKEK